MPLLFTPTTTIAVTYKLGRFHTLQPVGDPVAPWGEESAQRKLSFIIYHIINLGRTIWITSSSTFQYRCLSVDKGIVPLFRLREFRIDNPLTNKFTSGVQQQQVPQTDFINCWETHCWRRLLPDPLSAPTVGGSRWSVENEKSTTNKTVTVGR